jgi:hypothetical protein
MGKRLIYDIVLKCESKNRKSPAVKSGIGSSRQFMKGKNE